MLKVMRDNNKKIQSNQFKIEQGIKDVSGNMRSLTGSGGVEKKIDNISTFLLRMNNKIEALSRSGGGGRTAIFYKVSYSFCIRRDYIKSVIYRFLEG